MYTLVLTLHSIVRWVVILLGVWAAAQAFLGWLGRREWTGRDERSGLLFTMSMDVQILLGLVLYIFLSPLTQAAFRNLGEAMSSADLRFFAFDHIFMMLVALGLAHVGRALSRRAAAGPGRHRRAAIFFGLATLCVLLAIPWSRPWLRLG
jgi:hypothetical protein